MNTMKKSSKVLLSYYQYSCAIELEYSLHVIMLIYELAYSFELNMQNFMLNHSYNLYEQNQSQVEVVVHHAFGCAQVLYLSIRRVKDLGEFGQFLCTQAWCLGMEKQVNPFPTPWLRGRRQVVIALSIPCNPPCLGMTRAVGRRCLVDQVLFGARSKSIVAKLP